MVVAVVVVVKVAATTSRSQLPSALLPPRCLGSLSAFAFFSAPIAGVVGVAIAGCAWGLGFLGLGVSVWLRLTYRPHQDLISGI